MAYSEGEAVFFKKVRATMNYGLHWDAVISRRDPQSGRCHRSYKIHSSIKYGLHWDAVISRWAREHTNEVGALDVTKIIATQFLFTFHQIPFNFLCPQNYYISSTPPTFFAEKVFNSLYTLHRQLRCPKPTFLHKKRRSPALIPIL